MAVLAFTTTRIARHGDPCRSSRRPCVTHPLPVIRILTWSTTRASVRGPRRLRLSGSATGSCRDPPSSSAWQTPLPRFELSVPASVVGRAAMLRRRLPAAPHSRPHGGSGRAKVLQTAMFPSSLAGLQNRSPRPERAGGRSHSGGRRELRPGRCAGGCQRDRARGFLLADGCLPLTSARAERISASTSRPPRQRHSFMTWV